jgi:hypothetical protein
MRRAPRDRHHQQHVCPVGQKRCPTLARNEVGQKENRMDQIPNASAPDKGRRRLPNRRPHLSFDLEHFGARYRVGVGVWPDGPQAGEVAEIFLSAAKDGSDLDVNCRDGSIAISIALQSGVPLHGLAKAMCRDPRGQPSGILGLVLDLLAKEAGQ